MLWIRPLGFSKTLQPEAGCEMNSNQISCLKSNVELFRSLCFLEVTLVMQPLARLHAKRNHWLKRQKEFYEAVWQSNTGFEGRMCFWPSVKMLNHPYSWVFVASGNLTFKYSTNTWNTRKITHKIYMLWCVISKKVPPQSANCKTQTCFSNGNRTKLILRCLKTSFLREDRGSLVKHRKIVFSCPPFPSLSLLVVKRTSEEKVQSEGHIQTLVMDQLTRYFGRGTISDKTFAIFIY